MGIKHTKVSSKTDSADATLVRPSDWNDDHTIDGDVDFGGNDITNVGNVGEFTDLSDAPATYSGAGNKLVAVNAGATGLTFIAPSAGGPVDEFTDLLDVPGSYSGEAGKLVVVNAGETGLEFSESGGTLATLGWVTPQDYYPDAGQPGFISDTIDAADIAAHPEWIGTYKPNSYWSYVAIQEAIYGAYAYDSSTPGSVVWNNSVLAINKTLYMPPGDYYINHRLLMVAQDFNFMCSARGTSLIRWWGGKYITGTSHTSTTIDGIDASTLAQINTNDGLYIVGPGCTETNRCRVVSKLSSTSIQISEATTSSVSGQWYLFHSAFLCDAVSYGAFHNLSITAGSVMPSAYDETLSGDQNEDSTAPALFVMDYSGAHAGLKTQQLTLYDPRIIGNYVADIGISISPSGGAAQGDTILLVNPYVSQCLRSGLNVNGANALNIQVINGNFQACKYAGVKVVSGSVYVHGSSFQSGIFDQQTSPVLNSVINMSGDIHLRGFGGASSTSDIRAIRSEDENLVVAHSEADPSVSNVGTASTETLGRFNSYAFQLGHYIYQGNRVFVVVDCGGPNQWYFSPSGTGTTITLTGASFVVNAHVGLHVFERFGSNGFTWDVGTITSNTANTVTWTGTAATPAADSLYFIGGLTAGSDPGGWSTAATSTSVFRPIGVGQAFNLITAGSTTITMGSNFDGAAVGDYVIIPQADRLGATQAQVAGVGDRAPPRRCALITHITANNGGGSWEIAHAPKYTMDDAPGWVQCSGAPVLGTVIVDGDITWMPIDNFNFRGCHNLDKVTAKRVHSCKRVTQARLSNDLNWTAPVRSTSDDRNLALGQTLIMPTSNIEPSVTPVNISNTIMSGDLSYFTPTQNITLTADSFGTITPVGTGMQPGLQRWTLVVTTSGTTSYTITFGTGFKMASSTLVTGSVSGKRFIVECNILPGEPGVYTGGVYEVARTAAL